MKTNGKASVEDEQDDEDIEAGPEMPPAEDKGPDDEEGRFFGGGITRDTADVLDFMEEQDKGASVGLASTPRTPFLLHIHLQMAALTPWAQCGAQKIDAQPHFGGFMCSHFWGKRLVNRGGHAAPAFGNRAFFLGAGAKGGSRNPRRLI